MKIRLTELRKEILESVKKAETPLRVKTIAKKLTSAPDLSTIYRALDFLEARKFICSVSFSGVRYYYSNNKGHGHFLICKECHEIVTFKDCSVVELQKKIQKRYDYRITDHVLYFEGLCSECRTYLDKKSQVMNQ